mmetsp:Transcript_25801/g.66731  ORF Transcript_25801/g.66731 Transcript_25801/m.66731 type:complete len:295 (-) Transcript_25801:34-918(-)
MASALFSGHSNLVLRRPEESSQLAVRRGIETLQQTPGPKLEGDAHAVFIHTMCVVAVAHVCALHQARAQVHSNMLCKFLRTVLPVLNAQDEGGHWEPANAMHVGSIGEEWAFLERIGSADCLVKSGLRYCRRLAADKWHATKHQKVHCGTVSPRRKRRIFGALIATQVSSARIQIVAPCPRRGMPEESKIFCLNSARSTGQRPDGTWIIDGTWTGFSEKAPSVGALPALLIAPERGLHPVESPKHGQRPATGCVFCSSSRAAATWAIGNPARFWTGTSGGSNAADHGREMRFLH